ncbi:TorF family putative porin [Massilia sp. CMS3.1]|uniref:TorF family putative porin n=1 Tax=Massilia sp. CMS3.1 TaxID=3373083 RepID=UPI003EE5BD2E
MKNKLAGNAAGGAAILALAMMVGTAAQAQEAPAAEHQLSYNAALTSEYRYRGLSQTRFDPALQGGADYTHSPSGFYVGTWLSTIKWTKDLGGDGNVEVDLYAGKRGQITDAISYDVGGLYYWYPSNDLNPDANTFELYGQVGFGPAYLKYSHATTNLFGTTNSKQSGYLDLGANVPIEAVAGLVLNLHVGRQRVKNNGQFSYTDYKVGLTKDLGFASVSLAWIKANTESYLSPTGRNLGKSAAVLSVSKTF